MCGSARRNSSSTPSVGVVVMAGLNLIRPVGYAQRRTGSRGVKLLGTCPRPIGPKPRTYDRVRWPRISGSASASSGAARTKLEDTARRAEDLGFDVIHIADHLGRLAPFPVMTAIAMAT